MDRKEAIEVVRKKVDYYEADKRLKAALEALIPELQESEDEKNWKAVLEYVKDDALRVWLEKQKEQKPAEQTAEEKEYVLTIKSLVADAIRLAECNEVKDEVLGEIIAQSCPNIDFYQRLIAWVEGRHVYQSAEWSEEDEKMRESAISFVQAVNSCRYILGVDKHDVINWLKSRRPQPQWKPSEEQMNGLAHAINLDVYDAKRYHLDSLFDDLKKL